MPVDNDRRAGLGIAFFILALGLLASAAGWRAITRHEQAEMSGATKRAAEGIKIDLLNDMEWQIVGLDRLAMLWETANPPQPIWTKNAELYIEHRPGCIAVEWLTLERTKTAVITKAGVQGPLAFDGLPTGLIEAASHSQQALISAPETAQGGARQWIIAYPVYARGKLRGYIVTFYDAEKSLDYILGDVKNLGFSFGVTLPSQSEWVIPGTNRKHEQEWGTVVEVPLQGMTWQLRVWPNPDVVNEVKSRVPELVLIGGCLLSTLLALSLYFAARAHHSSSRTRQANDELQREISTRQGAQQELRRAHSELATRVEQRTAELAETNAMLRKEIAERKQSEDSLRKLTARLFQLQDQERQRLARELHDGATQNLVALSLDIGMIRDTIPCSDINAMNLIQECARLAEESTRELRSVSYLLHPPYFDELGLAAALRDFADGFSSRSGLNISMAFDPALGRLGNELELGIFRIVQEALSNIHRHAQSRTASIELARNTQHVHLKIADRGRGIPPEFLVPGGTGHTGVGITGMRERVRLLGGELDIQSSSAGTTIHAVFPLLNPELTSGCGEAAATAMTNRGSTLVA